MLAAQPSATYVAVAPERANVDYAARRQLRGGADCDASVPQLSLPRLRGRVRVGALHEHREAVASARAPETGRHDTGSHVVRLAGSPTEEGRRDRSGAPPGIQQMVAGRRGRALRRGRGAVLGGRIRRRAPRHRRRILAGRHRLSSLRLGRAGVPAAAGPRRPAGSRRGELDESHPADAGGRIAAGPVQLCRLPVRAARPWRSDPAVLRRARRARPRHRGPQGEAADATRAGSAA